MESCSSNLKYNSIKEEFGTANALHHMLRTPITCILGFTHLLNSEGLIFKQKEYVRNIETATRQLLSVLDCLLEEIKQCKQKEL